MSLTIVGVVVLAVFSVVGLVRAGVYTAPAIGTTAFFVVLALLMSSVARQLGRGKAWARSVVITWSIILFLSFLTLVRLLEWQAYVAMAFGAATLVALVLPSSRRFIQRRRLLDDPDGRS